MLRRMLAVWFLLMLVAASANAADQAAPGNSTGVTGLFVTTKYPALTIRAGETTTIDVSVRNFRLPPQLLNLSVPQAADGWKAPILGGGQPVGAVEVAPDSEERLQLRLEPPAGIGHGDYLRGSPTTAFKYKVSVTNDSGRDATINFSADAPKNFQTGFTEAYASQQITSIPIEAGKSKDVEAALTIPRDSPAGDYKLVLHAKTEAASADLPVSLTIVGQPRLAVSGEGGRLSGEAYAGQNSQLTVVLRNDGSEAAREIELNATTPEGWKSSFEPKQVAQLGPGATQDVKVSLTPSPRAIAGDYQTTIRASAAGGLSESANFRITVLTSTLWGAVGIAIIAIALLVVVFAVARFGRR